MTPLERYTAAFYAGWLAASKITDQSWLTLSQVQKDVIIAGMQSALAEMARFQSGAMLVKGGKVYTDPETMKPIGEVAAGQVWRAMLSEVE